MQIGSHIGHYVVLQRLGEGGMGSVYLVEHVELKTRHAIKVLLPHLSGHQQIVQRFRNEARAAAATKSPNIVAVRDFGQLETGAWYHIMDYWEGMTLGQFLVSRGRLPHDVILRITFDALNGLAAAHARNIIHRDLKPDNLYLAQVDRDTRTMLLDFGVCRLGEEAGLVTRSGAIVGTPRYMAPEQLRGQAIDHRADLWAIGAIVYEMATGGWLPYDDEVRQSAVVDDAALSARMSYPPVDPQRRAPTISRAFADAILALIDVDPTRRPTSAAAAAQLLADTLPSGHGQSGLAILEKRAPDLLPSVDLRSTLRTMRATNDGTPTKYAIRHKIGSGGMAEVFRAESMGLSGFTKAVALKRVLPGFSEQPLFAAMFNEEAQIASQLNHINIVSVLDYDRDSDGLFLIMEFVDGKDLGALLASGRLPPSVAIFIASEILRGLAYAHNLPDANGNIRGVVHRDISPQNVLLSWEGAVKVSDFGIAKALGAGSLESAWIKGKPSYMSPEQANAEPLDGRSDVFSTGVVLWECLTGTRLYKGGTKETIAQILFRDIEAPSRGTPGISADVDRVVLKLLARDRAARFATAQEAVDALAACGASPRDGRTELMRLLAIRFPAAVKARSQGRGTPDLMVDQVPVPAVSTLGSAASQSSPRYPKKTSWRRLWLLGVLALGAAALSFGIGTAIHRASIASSMGSASVNTAAQVRATEPPNNPVLATAATAATRANDAGLVDAAASADMTAIVPSDAASPTVAMKPPADVASPSAATRPPADAASPNVATKPLTDVGMPPASNALAPSTPPSDAAEHGATAAVPAHSPVETGKLNVYVAPFAQVWVDDAATSAGQTPLHLKLRVGHHRIRIENKRIHREETVNVTITTAKEATIDETWQ